MYPRGSRFQRSGKGRTSPYETETLWKVLDMALELPLEENVAFSTLVPADEAMMDTCFSIFSPGCRRFRLRKRSTLLDSNSHKDNAAHAHKVGK